jgi:hypothetical protein
MNDHSRSIDIKHHGIKQDSYIQDDMRIGGVASLNNTSGILTKNLQPPLHAKHCSQLHILTPSVINPTNLLTNNVTHATLKYPPYVPPHKRCNQDCKPTHHTPQTTRRTQKHWTNPKKNHCKHTHSTCPRQHNTKLKTSHLHHDRLRTHNTRKYTINQHKHIEHKRMKTKLKSRQNQHPQKRKSTKCPHDIKFGFPPITSKRRQKHFEISSQSNVFPVCKYTPMEQITRNAPIKNIHCA